MLTIYKQYGFIDSADYFRFLSESFGIGIVDVHAVSDLLSEEDDFNGLVQMLDDIYGVSNERLH